MIEVISNRQKDLAKWALRYALKKGSSSVSISIYTSTENSFEYRNNQLDILQKSVKTKMLIQLYVNGRFASYVTNQLEKKELEWFIAHGVETTRLLEVDLFRGLPEKSRIYTGDGKGLNIFDESIQMIHLDEKLALLEDNFKEVHLLDNRLISILVEYSDSLIGEYKISSNDFEGEMATTNFSLMVETAMKDKCDSRPSAYAITTSPFWNGFKKIGIGKIAYEKNLRKLGQTKIKSGIYKMLVDNIVLDKLLAPLIYAMYGRAIQQKSSFLINKLQQKIISDKITIIDNPHLKRTIGARWFDDEGVATQNMVVILNGILNIYYIDTYYSKKLVTTPTVQSPSILVFKHGNENFDQMMSSIEKGIWVTDFNGGNTNSTTGDFSFGIEGVLIENGKIETPLYEMNITGNLLELWNNVEKVGNDPYMDTSWQTPSILFNDVAFSGK